MSTKAMMVVAIALTTAALTTAPTSQASAQTRSQSHSYDRGAYAQQPRRTHSAHRSRSVYNIRGRYRGSDPDPFIRDQLRRCREC
jgi:hypothetical protein